jgi:hypothetical protein
VLVRRDRNGQLIDADGFLVNGYQVHRSTGQMCEVVGKLSPLDRIPQRRHRVGANVMWSQGMPMVPVGEKLLDPPKLATTAPRRGDHRRARSRPAHRRRGSRRFTASSPPGGDDGSGDPEPSGLALPQTGRHDKAGARAAG